MAGLKDFFNRPPKLPLIDGDALNLKVLSPQLAAVIKTYLGKLDKEHLGLVEREQLQTLYARLEGAEYTIVVKGHHGGYGPPIDQIKPIPPNPKRK